MNVTRYNKVESGTDEPFRVRVRLVSVGDQQPIHLESMLETGLNFSEFISNKSGIYFLYNETDLLYVGKANKLSKRIKQHFNSGRIPFTHYLYDEFDNSEIIPQVERALIKELKPIYNVQHN